ncbi:MAG: virulence RhuM family protein [Thermoanaerobaculia bacterium]|nr:virulence RhuM family protein [Thermoanaerobaculia bacterium]
MKALASEFILYQTPDGRSRLQVRLAEGTVWLTQAQMAELYQVTRQNISHHLRQIFEDGELGRGATSKPYLTVQPEGTRSVQRELEHFNLEMILAVGYRVRSARGTQFRRWATEQLRELLIKGFVLDDERLKEGGVFEGDYFDELLERIRDIRASERRFYQKITDIYATAIDYDAGSPLTQEFFATVQNKLHWAIHGHTAAEIVHERADASKPHMGLTTWRQGLHGPIRRQDTYVAKNYLSAEELRDLNRIVTMYLDYAEEQARRRRTVTMKEWREKLDAFLTFNDRAVLGHAGRISAELAKQKAENEFDLYVAERRRLEAQHPSSDFDRFVATTRLLKSET